MFGIEQLPSDALGHLSVYLETQDMIAFSSACKDLLGFTRYVRVLSIRLPPPAKTRGERSMHIQSKRQGIGLSTLLDRVHLADHIILRDTSCPIRLDRALAKRSSLDMNVKKLTISTGTSDALTTKQAGFIVSVLSILRPVYVCIDDNCRGHRGAIDRIAFEASRDASVSHLKFHAASLHLRKIIDGLDARENIPLVSLSIGYTDNNLRGLLFHPHCEYLHELSLGFVNFENMVDIGQYLRYTLAPLLKRLKIWRCWAIDAAPIIEAFEEGAAPLLESITISGPSLEGNLGVRLANGLRGKPLREIRIFHCHMDTQAMTHLLNTLSSFPRLKKLDVQNTYMKRMNDITLSHDGLVAGLESVVLRHHNLGQGAGTFMKMMVNSPCKDTLLHLDLSDCHLDDAAFVEIGKQIHKLRSLQTIDLSGNCIGDMGIHFLSSGLERHTGIAKVPLL